LAVAPGAGRRLSEEIANRLLWREPSAREALPNMKPGPVEVMVDRLAEYPGKIRVTAVVDVYTFEKDMRGILAETVRVTAESIISEVKKEVGEKLAEELRMKVLAEVDMKAMSNMVLARAVGKIAGNLAK
jgi:hypothetical protein